MGGSVETGVEGIDDNEIANEPTRHAIKQVYGPIGISENNGDNATEQQQAKTHAIDNKPYMPEPDPLN